MKTNIVSTIAGNDYHGYYGEYIVDVYFLTIDNVGNVFFYGSTKKHHSKN
jgi:hypothetical protein